MGAVLIPKLLAAGHRVKVLDLFIYGPEALAPVAGHPNLVQIKGDIRDRALLERSIAGCDAVIHLACISNDPSFELNPGLGKSINYDAFGPLVDVSKDLGVKRFIYASSSSVYGISDEENVTENLALKPLTDYSKYKALCEDVLLQKKETGFVPVILRPATVCGYSPRLRLDLVVNLLTNQAVNTNQIKVFGGQQKRPNIHIEDVTDMYVQSLEWADSIVDGNIYNAGYDNQTVSEIAETVRGSIGPNVEITSVPTDDNRSYHISSAKILKETGFAPNHSIDEAVSDLVSAFGAGKIPDALSNPNYFNIKKMQELALK